MVRLLAHLSDLHLGRNRANDRRAEALCRSLVDRGVDHVVVTGDVTHRGRRDELALFRALFAPLAERGRLTVVPGNHDRLGDDVADELHAGARVRVEKRPGLHLVCVDSTGPHNRSLLASHGALSEEDIEATAAACAAAPPETLALVALHHHVLPLSHDSVSERVASWFSSSGAELSGGATLLSRLRGRCHLVLHGHRHAPAVTTVFPNDARAVRVFNAGSSTELGQVRLFVHRGGRLLVPPVWVRGQALVATRLRERVITYPRLPVAVRAKGEPHARTCEP